MYSYPPKRAQTTELLFCPECGQVQVARIVQDITLSDGVKVERLDHFKCKACGFRLFDDQAMQAIHEARSRHSSTTPSA